LEGEWKSFEAEVKKYLETVGKDIEQQKTIFQGQFAAQMKVWREAADKIHGAAAEFAAERRKDLDATASRMRADAAAAEDKLQSLHGGQRILVCSQRRLSGNACCFRSRQSGCPRGIQARYRLGPVSRSFDGVKDAG